MLHKDLTGDDLHVNKLHAATHLVGGTDPLALELRPNGTDDTADINNAITALADLTNGGTLKLAAGTFRYSQIKLKTNVYLVGAGDATVLQPIAGSTVNSIILNDDSVSPCGLSDLLIDGDKANNTCPALIYLNRSTIPAGSNFDAHILLENIKVTNGYGDGIVINTGIREMRMVNITLSGNGGWGIKNIAGSDNFMEMITTSSNTLGGVSETGTAERWVNCKAFGNGDIAHRSPGFYAKGTLFSFIACEAQENYGHGFMLDGCFSCIFDIVSSSNGLTSGVLTTPSDLAYNGVEVVSASETTIIGQIYDFHNAWHSAPTQNIGVHVIAGSHVLVNVNSRWQQVDAVAPVDATILVIVNGVLQSLTTTIAELNFVKNTRSELQTQIDNKLAFTPTNIVTNGGLEVNTTGWGSWHATLSLETAAPLVGAGSLKILLTDVNGNGDMAMTTIIGHQYKATCLAKSTAAAGRLSQLQAQQVGGNLSGTSVDCSSVQTLTIIFTATGTTATFAATLLSGIADESLLIDSVVCYDLTAGTTATIPDINKLHSATAAFQLSALNTAPANAGDTGTPLEVRITADAIYVCTATNTWVKAALATWP